MKLFCQVFVKLRAIPDHCDGILCFVLRVVCDSLLFVCRVCSFLCVVYFEEIGSSMVREVLESLESQADRI